MARRSRRLPLWPAPAVRRRWLRRWRRAPPPVRVSIGVLLVAVLTLGVNGIYQVVRKPTELFFPVSGTLYKTPSETWRVYAPIFRRYATRTITPELLAALAQVEASGNPLVRTYWRWSWALKPFELYRPASSAVGMYQITDGTFAEARRYCIHGHAVVREDLKVSAILGRFAVTRATSAQQRHLAAAVHLCGAALGATYVRQGFRFTDTQRCGDQDPRAYLGRVDAMQAVFARLAAEQEGGAVPNSH
ncbi:MAG: lytic transglycosylase domain-containing protein [Gammaproteobacteria bacterium]|nr:MAG: lytic transglycosylase domain-containing protein [Gammaproteobacteria bacterium]